MMSKLDRIFTHKFKEIVKVKTIDENGIEFTDGTKLSHNHDQDCCESVYADWKQLEDTPIWDEEFRTLSIKGNKGFGFRIKRGYFVPCYNAQNGYYSSSLELVIETRPGLIHKVDITEFVEDQIN